MLRRIFAYIILCIFGTTGFSACSDLLQKEEPKYNVISESMFKDTEENGCKYLLDSYCDHLYSPEASGNILISREIPIQILQGEAYNQLPQSFVKYSLAKIRNRYGFPWEFRKTLDSYSYFEKLQEYIDRKPLPLMTLEERKRTIHLREELGFIWDTAIEQTVMQKMANKYPGYYQITDKLMPVEYEVEGRRARRKLISDVSHVIWHQDKNWKKVEDGFRDLKKSFYAVFDKLEIPDATRADWKKKIASIELVLPGSVPEISDDECSTTTANAYYYRHLNLITVCAGDFNSEDILLTIAHEMSHALDVNREMYLFEKTSALGMRMQEVRNNVCNTKAPMDCSLWKNFRQDFPQLLHSISGFQPQLPEFGACLMKDAPKKNIDEESAKRIAGSIAKERIAELATNDLFLRIIKPKLPMSNGNMQKNPNFSNPCSYYVWSKNEESIDDELYSLIFFTAEYRCSELAPVDNFKLSIEKSRDMTADLLSGLIKSEGAFSDRPEVVAEGLASSPVERFADVIGTYAVSEFLNRFNSVWERRSKYLASSSWLCEEPSLASSFPAESRVENFFTEDSHSDNADRKKEIFSQPIRDALHCNKDFEFKECSLEFKNTPKNSFPVKQAYLDLEN